MDKKLITCPNCGAQMGMSQLLELECPYCGSKFENPLNQRSEDRVIKKIISFSLTANDVREILFKEFVYKDDVAKDIFDKLQIHTLKQYYLPMYLFYGKYRADWSCTVIYEQKDKQGNKIEEYRPASGTATGNFSKLTLACGAGRNLPQGVKRYANVLECTSKLNSKMTKFEASYLVSENKEAIEVIESNISEKEAWNKSALQASIEKDAKDAAHSQTPHRVIEDYNVTANWEGSVGELVLVPVWYGSYSYNGEEYFFAIDGRGTNFDYSFPHDSTDEVRGWKVVGRFFLMVGLLIGIIGITSTKQTMPIIIALLGAVALTVRFVMEYNKSSDDLTAIKQIGKARFCNEDIPNSSSNYVQYKRTNQIAMWVLIALIATWCFGAKMIEKKRWAQQQAQEQAMVEEAQKMINRITHDLFFYQSKEQVGHLRQDVRKKLNALGFIREDNEPGEFGEKYALYSNQIPLVNVYLNFDPVASYSNFSDGIKDIKITIVDDRFSSSFIEGFKSQLTENGYEIKRYPTSNSYPSRPDGAYMKIGKEAFKEDIFGFNKHYAMYNAIIIWGNEIKCYAKDEFQEDMKTGYEKILTDSVTNYDKGNDHVGGINCSLTGEISSIQNVKMILRGNKGTLTYVMDGKKIVSDIVLDDKASSIDKDGFGHLVLNSYAQDGKLKGRFIGEMDSAECGYLYEGTFVNVNGGSTTFFLSE